MQEIYKEDDIRKRERINKRLEIFIPLFLIIGILIYNIPWMQKVNITYDGIEWNLDDSQYYNKVSLEMKGNYYRYLLRPNVYKGTLKITGYTDNSDYVIYNDTVQLNFNDSCIRIHNSSAYGEYDDKIVWEMLWDGRFETLVFKVFETYGNNNSLTFWDGKSGYI